MTSLLVLFSCAKEAAITDREVAGESPSVPGQVLTIHASIPEGGLTKVSMEQDALNPDGAIKLAWEADDVLTVTDASEPANSVTFTLQSGAGEKDATFTGTTPSGWTGPFKVSYSSAGKSYNYNVQTQAADGSTEHLKYVATLNGVTDLEHFAFSKDWADAHSATLSSSSVLRIRVQMPDGVAAKVKSMTLKTPAAPGAMVLNLATPSDAEGDGILNLYMTIPAGDIAIPEGMPVALAFSTDDADCFTRVHIFAAESNLLSGRVNALKFNCKSLVNSASEIIVPGDGSSAYPYLIGDKYQLQTLQLLLGSETTFVKLVDDIDMDGETWTCLNPSAPYLPVDLDGNGKTISKLSSSLFYVLKGSVRDLTLDQSNIKKRGALAEYIQASGNVVSNVNVTKGTVTSTNSNVGGLIGNINNGTSEDLVTAIVSNCTVSETDVTGAGVVGGVIGYADAKVSVSGCKFVGGTVKASAKYSGGFLGSIGEHASVVSDCQVEDATIESTCTADARCGGFVGQIGIATASVNGCSVGTSEKRVIIKLATPASEKVLNSGGFVGVCYGNIGSYGETRSKVYATISSTNTSAATRLNLGGFAGYVQKCTIEHSDADVVMTGLKGTHVGGFAGYLTSSACIIDDCTATGEVTGNNYTGGFAGYIDKGASTISNNTSSGSVAAGSSVGGFAGLIAGGTLDKNTTSCTVSGATNVGAFVGAINGGSLSRCASIGDTVTGTGNVCGGFVGLSSTGDGSASLSDCYTTTNIGTTTRKIGGLVGHVNAGNLEITRCYATSNIRAQFEAGGLIGFINVAGLNMSKSVAWNSSVFATSRGATNWSTAAVSGVTFLTCTLTDNYRNPNMQLTAYWGNTSDSTVQLAADFQHPDVSASAPLTDKDGNAVTHANVRPYQGKVEAGKTLSQLASTTLGWSADVWDFSEDLPKLK